MRNVELIVSDTARLSERHYRLTENVYFVGAEGAQDGSQEFIGIRSAAVNPRHLEISRSYTGWAVTAHGPDVALGDVVLPVGSKCPLVSGSEILIGEHVLRVKEADDAVGAADDTAPPLDRHDLGEFERGLHLQLVELVRGADYLDGGMGGGDVEGYRQLVSSELDRITSQALAQCSERARQTLAGAAIYRRLKHRCIASGSAMDVTATYSGLSAEDAQALRQIEGELLTTLGVEMRPRETREDMARLRSGFDDVFDGVNLRLIRPDLRRRIVHEAVRQSIMSLYFGLGPLQPLLDNDQIGEIMICRHDQVFVEKHGKLIETGLSFASEDALLSIIERIMGEVGKRVNQGNPYEDARLSDGSRVNAVVPPIAVKGPALTIRKFRSAPLTLDELLAGGSLSEAMAEFLRRCVLARLNVVISGGTGTGKTTMLNWLAGMISPTERLVTVEDTAELRLYQTHVVTLEARPPNAEGRGAVTIRDLVKNALRMRPDRILVGECRGGESFDMLQAMNTGHDGSMTTAHANNPVEMIARLENLVLMAGQDLPISAIRHQISHAVDYIVQLKRFADGARRVIEIAEVGDVEPETGMIEVDPVFRYLETSEDPAETVSEKGQAAPRFMFLGHTPRHLDRLIRAGLDPRIFGADESRRPEVCDV